MERGPYTDAAEVRLLPPPGPHEAVLRVGWQARLVLLLTLLNQHVTISLSRIQPSTHAGVAAAEVASAAAQVLRGRF